MYTFTTSENIHVWTNTQGQYLASIEGNIDMASHGESLRYYKTSDNMINDLYLLGFKDSARELNKDLSK